MKLSEIQNKEVWESFLLQCTEKTFLQSWNWGEFNLASGNKIWRFGVYDLSAQAGNDKLISVVMVVKVSAKRGTFLFIPHGPVVLENLQVKDKKEILQAIVRQVLEMAKEGQTLVRTLMQQLKVPIR